MKLLLTVLVLILKLEFGFCQLLRHGISNKRIDIEYLKIEPLRSDYKLLYKDRSDSLGNQILVFENIKEPLTAMLFYFRSHDPNLCFKSEEILPIETLPNKVIEFNSKYKFIGNGLWEDENNWISMQIDYAIGETFFIVSYFNSLDGGR